jgi:hypothetical protein
MAEGAFALSPLSASPRAAETTDADYEAIREAFMETSRGRWFLGEYSKRNRNADTSMVLEAVARIEQSIAAAKVEPVIPEPPSPDPALAALAQARSAIEGALAEPVLDQALGPWRRSSRIIQEIAWALRESGADSRICDILDSQVRSIEAACNEFPWVDIRAQVLSALDAAARQIDPDALTRPEPPADILDVDLAAKPELVEIEAAPAETADAGIDLSLQASSEPVQETAAEDAAEAVVMAESAVITESVSEPATILDELPSIVAEERSAPTEMAAATEPVIQQAADAPVRPETSVVIPADAAQAADASPISLGASLIARGVVRQPLSSRPDPMAALRRMSHAERIAFFS